MREPGPRKVQIRLVLEHARFGDFYSALNGVVDLIDHFVIRGVAERF